MRFGTIIILSCFISSPALAWEFPLFTPKRNCEKLIINLLRESEETVDIAVYAINNDRIVPEIIKTHERGVKVRVLTDRLQAAGKSSRVPELYYVGLNLRVHSQNKIMHNKFAIFDGKYAITGSYNWTNPASDKNDENCLPMDDKEQVDAYAAQFRSLWQQNTKAKSDAWWERREKKLADTKK
jgi:phosphatidylserine/phosphatidylglycerophosphate/cardiolipin synthase-like enzyme